MIIETKKTERKVAIKENQIETFNKNGDQSKDTYSFDKWNLRVMAWGLGVDRDTYFNCKLLLYYFNLLLNYFNLCSKVFQ